MLNADFFFLIPPLLSFLSNWLLLSFVHYSFIGKHSLGSTSLYAHQRAGPNESSSFIFKVVFVGGNGHPEMHPWLAKCLYQRCLRLIRDGRDGAVDPWIARARTHRSTDSLWGSQTWKKMAKFVWEDRQTDQRTERQRSTSAAFASDLFFEWNWNHLSLFSQSPIITMETRRTNLDRAGNR